VDRQAAAAVPVLAKALEDEDGRVRGSAAWGLGEIGPDAKEALAPLRQLLRDEDPAVRLCAAYGVWRVGRLAKEVAPVLSALWQEEPDTRVFLPYQLEVVRGLGEMGREDKAAVETLVRLTGHHNRWVRQTAAEALKKADPKAAADAGVR
jgi:HEAT repeat protein